ncbi:hypothetical protein [Chromobacterium haemolyticum]|uniref:hypothetical protein n=1 Tax=Chromobacterium haemolyticum TaxID=394935 RepID=UPI0011B24E5E|nr:hypothetical protein [Chromobacterium haemolyticum]
MKVLCLFDSGEHVRSEERFLAESGDTKYSPLEVGGVYHVMGIIFYEKRIDYLVNKKNIQPIWAPSSLFRIESNKLPQHFSAEKINGGQYNWLAQEYGAKFIIGYPALVNSFSHFVGLQEREATDLAIFYSAFKEGYGEQELEL